MVSKSTLIAFLSLKGSSHTRLIKAFSLIAALLLLVTATLYHYLIYLPQPDRPHRFTLLDDVFALGVVLLIGAAGLVLGRRVLTAFTLRGMTRLEQGALSLGLGWGVLSFAVLLLGLVHLLYTWTLLIGLSLVIVVC